MPAWGSELGEDAAARLTAELPDYEMFAYRTWEQVAGYFDGDGTLGFSDTSNQPYKLGISLAFVDQSKEQLAMLKEFLEGRGIRTSNLLKTSKGTATLLVVSRHQSVTSALVAMLPYLFKKAREAQGVLDYYRGAITGNALAALFEIEVKAGRRERRARKVNIGVPYSFPEGAFLMKRRRRERIREAIAKSRAKVSQDDLERIREEHFALGVPLHELLRRHPDYSKETVRRILGRDRGYVLVKGRGLVETTDSR